MALAVPTPHAVFASFEPSSTYTILLIVVSKDMLCHEFPLTFGRPSLFVNLLCSSASLRWLSLVTLLLNIRKTPINWLVVVDRLHDR